MSVAMLNWVWEKERTNEKTAGRNRNIFFKEDKADI
jgi:hypothetical protein